MNNTGAPLHPLLSAIPDIGRPLTLKSTYCLLGCGQEHIQVARADLACAEPLASVLEEPLKSTSLLWLPSLTGGGQ